MSRRRTRPAFLRGDDAAELLPAQGRLHQRPLCEHRAHAQLQRLAREVACVPIETEDTVDIGWISIRGRALRPIEEAFLACMKRHILAAQG